MTKLTAEEYLGKSDCPMNHLPSGFWEYDHEGLMKVMEDYAKYRESLKLQEYKEGLVKGKECNASWQVSPIVGGVAYKIKCRNCDAILEAGKTPECLKKQ